MNKDIADRWVAALRSGKYAQTRGCLEVVKEEDDTPVGFCCLGVLSCLAVEGGIVERTIDERGVAASFHPKNSDPYYGSISFLPGVVRDWAGINSDDGRFGGVNDSLTRMNDGEKELDGTIVNQKSFAEIADFIEQNYMSL